MLQEKYLHTTCTSTWVRTAPTASSGMVKSETVLDKFLVNLEPVRQGQPCAAVSGIR
ncbi:MAG: hypothetical protein ACLR0U_18760 [Enterocloster clostridioformis]